MRSFGLVGLGILASGLLVNAYLAIVARSVPAAEYAYFGAFWSLTQVVGFGAFLSVEQETARLLQMPGRGAGVLKSVLLTAAWMAAAELAVIAIGWPVVLRAFGGHPATVLALVVLVLRVRGAVRGAGSAHRARPVGSARRDHGGRLDAEGRFRRARRRDRGDAPAVRRSHGRWLPPSSALTRRSCWPCSPVHRVALAPSRIGSAASLSGPPSHRCSWARSARSSCSTGLPCSCRALATDVASATRAGQFVATFTLTRVALFLVVPLQTALLPALTASLHSGDRAVLRRWLHRLSVAVVAFGAVAMTIGFVTGPRLVALIFGEQYALPGGDVALLSLGVAVYTGLVIVTQVLVAAVRHRLVAWSWLSGLLVAAVVFALVPEPMLRAELAFLLGSTTGWLVGTVLPLIDRRERVMTACAVTTSRMTSSSR